MNELVLNGDDETRDHLEHAEDRDRDGAVEQRVAALLAVLAHVHLPRVDAVVEHAGEDEGDGRAEHRAGDRDEDAEVGDDEREPDAERDEGDAHRGAAPQAVLVLRAGHDDVPRAARDDRVDRERADHVQHDERPADVRDDVLLGEVAQEVAAVARVHRLGPAERVDAAEPDGDVQRRADEHRDDRREHHAARRAVLELAVQRRHVHVEDVGGRHDAEGGEEAAREPEGLDDLRLGDVLGAAVAPGAGRPDVHDERDEDDGDEAEDGDDEELVEAADGREEREEAAADEHPEPVARPDALAEDAEAQVRHRVLDDGRVDHEHGEVAEQDEALGEVAHELRREAREGLDDEPAERVDVRRVAALAHEVHGARREERAEQADDQRGDDARLREREGQRQDPAADHRAEDVRGGREDGRVRVVVGRGVDGDGRVGGQRAVGLFHWRGENGGKGRYRGKRVGERSGYTNTLEIFRKVVLRGEKSFLNEILRKTSSGEKGGLSPKEGEGLPQTLACISAIYCGHTQAV